jgi:hypothetical protein
MTAPHPVADALTPAERFEAAVRDAVLPRLLAPGEDTGPYLLCESQLADIGAAADEYAAALVERCARTPRSQEDPLQPRGAAS